MCAQRASFCLAISPLLFCGVTLAQQLPFAIGLNALGPENSGMAQRAGLWDVVETTWDCPNSGPTSKNLVAERRMIGSFLEEVLEPAPKSLPADIKRIDYLSFDRMEGRWKYVSMGTRAPVGIMPASSADRGQQGTIRLTFEPFAVPAATANVTGQLVLMQETITQDGADRDQKNTSIWPMEQARAGWPTAMHMCGN